MIEAEQHHQSSCSCRLSSARAELCAADSAARCGSSDVIPRVTPSQATKIPPASLRFRRAWPQPGISMERQSALRGLMYWRCSVSGGAVPAASRRTAAEIAARPAAGATEQQEKYRSRQRPRAAARVAGACGNRTHRSRRRRLHRGFEDRPDHQARSAPVWKVSGER